MAAAVPQHLDLELQPRCTLELQQGCASGPGASPEHAAAFAPRAAPAADPPAACSDISDGQLLALTDTASLTADQLDRRHHLLRHSLPDEARGDSVLVHFEVGSAHEAVKLIKKMSQRDLQAKFRLVYGAKTFSNNNNWLRRKLFEAIGVDPAKGAVKKAAAASGGGRRRRGAGRGGTRAVTRAPRASPRASARAAGAAWYSRQYDGAEAQYGHYDAAEEQYGQYMEDDMEDEDHEHACQALLALGDAAASLEESCSEGSVPSVSLTAGATAPTPAEELPLGSSGATATTLVLKAEDEEHAHAAGGSAAFRRLLLEQHEAQRAVAASQAAHAAAAAAAGADFAGWLAMVQRHAVAVAAGEEAAAAGDAQHVAEAVRSAAMQHHPMLAASMGLLGGAHYMPMAAAAHGWAGMPMLPALFPQPHGGACAGGVPPAMLSALHHLVAAQHHHTVPGMPPMYAAK